jgi:pimeloyl-ACP methyl ester carboxylesterase
MRDTAPGKIAPNDSSHGAAQITPCHDARGATLAVRHYPESGEPIVLLHGGPGFLMQFAGRIGDLGFGYIMKQLLPNYVVRRDAAPKEFDVHRASKRAWRGTNRSIKALDDDYLARVSFDAPVLIVQGEHDVIRETNPLLTERFPAATNVRIENAAHFPWLEQADVFGKTILRFYGKAVATE